MTKVSRDARNTESGYKFSNFYFYGVLLQRLAKDGPFAEYFIISVSSVCIPTPGLQSTFSPQSFFYPQSADAVRNLRFTLTDQL